MTEFIFGKYRLMRRLLVPTSIIGLQQALLGLTLTGFDHGIWKRQGLISGITVRIELISIPLPLYGSKAILAFKLAAFESKPSNS